MQIDKEFQTLIPTLTEEEFNQLEANILAEGITEPLVIWNNTLIDGHNRYEIANKHNLHYETREMDFDSRNDVKIWIIKHQFGRRNLAMPARCMLAEKLENELSLKAKENQRQSKGQGVKVSPNGETLKISSERDAAKMAGVGNGTYARYKKVAKSGIEEVKKKMDTGEMSINQAYQAVKREEKKAEVKKRIEDYAEVQTGVIDIAETQKKYNIIYADPPWQYWESGNKNQSSHYTTMTIDEICELPVKELADDNCILFMWVTYPILQAAFKVIESWGFKYSTAAFVWVKKNKNADTPFFGCGAWTRANSEICLLATKGSMQRLDATISQIVESPIEEHSKKPDVVRELIERLVGKLPRVELFCRNPADGWDVWGNEA